MQFYAWQWLTCASYRSDNELTKDTPYLTLSGELWRSVFGEYFEDEI